MLSRQELGLHRMNSEGTHIQSTTDRKKNFSKNEQGLRDWWDTTKCTDVHVMAAREVFLPQDICTHRSSA